MFGVTELKDDVTRLHSVHLLLQLLPAANRDTLAALLDFLNVVVAHSTDTIDANGETVRMARGGGIKCML